MLCNIKRSGLSWLGKYLTAKGRPGVGRLGFAVLFLIVLSSFALPAFCAEPWPTTRFKVFAGNPFEGDISMAAGGAASADGFDWLETQRFFAFVDFSGLGLSPEAKRDIERAFTEAAKWYIKMGLPAPKLEPLISNNGEPYYRIYVCNEYFGEGNPDRYNKCGYHPDPEKTKSGGYVPFCTGTSRNHMIAMNSVKNFSGDELNELGYQTVAHELMHAIISNTNFGRRHPTCTVGLWITEGLPDAISWDILEQIWPGRYLQNNRDKNLGKKYGYRPYSQRLPEGGVVVAPGTSGVMDYTYATSSFWRYLADSNNGWKGLLVNPKGNGLLDLTVSGLASNDTSRTNWQSEVNWLDKGLYGKFNQHLNEV